MIPKILIVDDEVIILKRLHKLLTKMNYDVVGSATNGKEAVTMARELNPDLILLDIKMPGKLNGIEAGGLIHDELGIPLIYITAHSDDRNIQKAKLTEPFGFLLKPYQQSELKAVIEITLFKVDADRKIRESEEKYRSLSENINIGIYRTTVESPGKFLEVNPAFIKMFGHASRQEVLSRPVTDFYSDPKDRDRILRKLSHCDSLKDEELTLKKKDGTSFFGSFTVTAVKDVDGKIICLDGVVENITKRKLAEEKTAQQNYLLNTVFNAVSHPLYLVDVNNYRVLMANAAAGPEKITKSTTCYKLTFNNNRPCSDDNYLCPIREIKRTKKPVIIEHKYRDIDGKNKFIEVYAYPVTNEDGEVVQMVQYNLELTERIELENQLRQAQKMEAIGQLAGGVAHDFNNKLCAIIGFAELALDDLNDKGSVSDYLNNIIDRSEKSARLTRQLLAFSRQQYLEIKQVDINQIMFEASRFLTKVLGAHIDLQLELAGEQQIIKADPNAIDQIITNLCINARDAMSNGGQLTLKTEKVMLNDDFCSGLPGLKPGEYVLFTITDSGHGIPEEMITHIFDPFYTTKEVGEGTGLGLSMVFGLVKQHNGYIDCKSEINKGTTFSIYFPIVTNIIDSDEIKADTQQQLRGTEHLLLVEDNLTLQKVTRSTLEDLGYTISSANNGEEAYSLFQELNNGIDMIISDVVMPREGGVELYKKIIDIDPALKFLFITGYASQKILSSLPNNDTTSVLIKPFKRKDIASKIRHLFDS